jgi:hypothetical protein
MNKSQYLKSRRSSISSHHPANKATSKLGVGVGMHSSAIRSCISKIYSNIGGWEKHNITSSQTKIIEVTGKSKG